MLDLEFQNEKQFDAGDLIWKKSLNELEVVGFTVSNLKLVSKLTNQTDSFIPFEFKRADNHKYDLIFIRILHAVVWPSGLRRWF